MTLHEWLDASSGRATWLAERLGRSKAAVSLWRDCGVPLQLMERIAELSAGEVSVDAMLRHALEKKTRTPEAAGAA